MSVEPPRQVYRTWIMGSRRRAEFRPRDDDVVIATHPKSGTTWMQRIVSLLVFQTAAPLPLWQISPWLERRFPEPVGSVLARLDAQSHRRFIKTHLPPDGLPLYPEIRYIHVARDGRDACLSYHHHFLGYSAEARAAFDREGRADPAMGRPLPALPEDPAEYFRLWQSCGIVPGHADGWPALSWFTVERQWWQRRGRRNLLLVHYADMKADLAGEMRRVSGFLGIAVDERRWPALVAPPPSPRCAATARPYSGTGRECGGTAVITSSPGAAAKAGAASCERRTSSSFGPRWPLNCRPTVLAGWSMDGWPLAVPRLDIGLTAPPDRPFTKLN